MAELPKRKGVRLEGYDYSQEGCYFITFCTRDRLHLLSKITVGDAALGVPNTELTETGLIVKKYIEGSERDNITLDHYVIMPNHVHLLISIKDGTPRAASPTKSVIPKAINAIKSLSTKEIGKELWQRGYYDHIIRDAKDYEARYCYIETNPSRWADDEYFRSHL